MYEVEWTNKGKLSSLIRSLRATNGQSADFGFFEDQGRHPSNPDYTLPEIMAMNELCHPPKFPVFQVAEQVYGSRFKRENHADLKAFLERAARGHEFSANNLLHKLGTNGESMIRDVFGNAALIGDNAVNYQIVKGRNAPMIDTGFMVNNVIHKISTKE